MSQENKGSALGGIIIVAALAFLGYTGIKAGINSFKTTVSGPKYKVGDCLAQKNDSQAERWEFKTTYRNVFRIEEVGTEKYRVQYWFGALSNDFIATRAAQTSETISYLDSDYSRYEPVDCNEMIQVHNREKEAYEAWRHANEGR